MNDIETRARRYTALAIGPQPKSPRAQCVFSALTPPGLPGGKLTAPRYLPQFCGTLRQNGLRTLVCCSTEQLKQALTSDCPTFLVHLFGEDRFQIASSTVLDIETQARAVFNSASVGPSLADKRKTHDTLTTAGVPMPALEPERGPTLVRYRQGSDQPVTLADAATSVESDKILTQFIDTRVAYKGRTYFATIRLLCIDDVILHAMPRARDAADGNPSVHSRDTPRDPDLVAYLHEALVVPNTDEFQQTAKAAYQALGHGFFSHDLLIEAETGRVFLCETGFKFDDLVYVRHLAPIRDLIPSQANLFPIESYAALSAQVFLERCNALLAE